MAISAIELRIGNILLLDTGHTLPQPHRIVPQDIVDIWGGLPEKINIEPIPLSSNILLKCGFTLDNYDVFYIKNKEGYLWVRPFESLFEVCVGQELDMLIKITDIQYLHQLQNLIFALQGTELIVNL